MAETLTDSKPQALNNKWMKRVCAVPYLPRAKGRIAAIDLARGIAIALMIMSHTVSGLLGLRLVPDWGLVPVHLLTKFSSSLFILVFGIALAVAFLPHAGGEEWRGRRRKLWLRALEVLFWYKALTVVEMLPLYPAKDILATLLWQNFAIWVEILGFYALALLWVPLLLPLWTRTPLWGRLLMPLGTAALAAWLQSYDFGGYVIVKALLVDHEDHYAWGQLSRAPLVMAGLLIGEVLLRCYFSRHWRRRLVLSILAAGTMMLAAFFLLALLAGDVHAALLAVARNVGKHPPGLAFMLFSVGGALVILAGSLAGGASLARWLKPVTVVGSDALKAFVFHIVAIFLVLRFLLDSWQVYSYLQVLAMGIALVLGAAGWIVLTRWIGANK